MVKAILKSTILGQFYLIWTAPTDGEAMYVFHNIVTAQKGGKV